MRTLQRADYTHSYVGDGGIVGYVRIRVYHREGKTPIIICSQLLHNRQGPSPTNYVEQLVREVVQRCRIRRPAWWRRSGTTDEIMRWIEHYPTEVGPNDVETYDVVVCDYRRGRGRLDIRRPRWARITRAAVEQMIGQSPDG